MMTWQEPGWLAMLLLLPGLLRLLRSAPRWVTTWVTVLHLLVAVGAAGPVLPGGKAPRRVWLALDGSASMGNRQQQTVTVVRELAARLDANDQLGIVLFGETAMVLQRPATPAHVAQSLADYPLRHPAPWRSDIRGALHFIHTYDPNHSEVVLWSDGQATTGAELLVPPTGMRLSTIAPTALEDWRVESLRGPLALKPGQGAALAAEIAASAPGSCQLTLRRDGILVTTVTVTMPAAGNLTVALLDSSPPPDTPGARHYRVELIAAQDALPGNEHASWHTTATDLPAVWWIGASADAWRSALAPLALVETLPAASLLRRLANGPLPEAIVLADPHRTDLDDATLTALVRYNDGGGALLFAGGPASLRSASFATSPLEERLPVELVPRSGQRPASALVLVDASGSMVELVNGHPKVSYARAALAALVESLDPTTELAIWRFDENAQCLVPRGDRANQQQALQGVIAPYHPSHPLRPAGATRLANALRAAIADLRLSNREQRHLLLISDGASDELADPQQAQQLAAALSVSPPITLTALRINSGPSLAEAELAKLARLSGGQLITASRVDELAQLLLDAYRSDRLRPLAPAGGRVSAGPAVSELTLALPAQWPPLGEFARTPLHPRGQTRALLQASEADGGDQWPLLARREDPGCGRCSYIQLTAATRWVASAWPDELQTRVVEFLASELAWLLAVSAEGRLRWEVRPLHGELEILATTDAATHQRLAVSCDDGVLQALSEIAPGLHRNRLSLLEGRHTLRLYREAAGHWQPVGAARLVEIIHGLELARGGSVDHERLAQLASQGGRFLARAREFAPAEATTHAWPAGGLILLIAALWLTSAIGLGALRYA